MLGFIESEVIILKKISLLLCILLVAGLVLSACGPAATPEPTPRPTATTAPTAIPSNIGWESIKDKISPDLPQFTYGTIRGDIKTDDDNVIEIVFAATNLSMIKKYATQLTDAGWTIDQEMKTSDDTFIASKDGWRIELFNVQSGILSFKIFPKAE